jgi:two-component system sensor histidine kinase HydH
MLAVTAGNVAASQRDVAVLQRSAEQGLETARRPGSCDDRGMIDKRPLLGLVAGVAIGLMDLTALSLLGVEMLWQGTDLSLAVMGVFTATFAALGFSIGHLADARAQLRERLVELERTQAQMLQYEKLASIGRMAAGVAHEVRNPLGVIKSSAALLVESLPDEDEDGRKAGRFIREEIDRLDGFIRSLLDFSRPIEPQRQSVELGDLAERIERLTEEPRRFTGASLSVETVGRGAWSVDSDLLARAVAALATNACQATGSGGRVAIRIDAANGRIVVADDGEGIDPEIRERLFEPFVTTKAKGTGLGSSMAARIVEAHGGQVVVVDGAGLGEGGAGACFEVRLTSDPALAEAA